MNNNDLHLYIEHVFDTASFLIYNMQTKQLSDFYQTSDFEQMIDVLCQKMITISWKNIKSIFVIDGPGSITGIRGLMSFLAGVIVVANIPIKYCNTFEIMFQVTSNLKMVLNSYMLAIHRAGPKYYILNNSYWNILNKTTNDVLKNYITVAELNEITKDQQIVGYNVQKIQSYFQNVAISAQNMISNIKDGDNMVKYRDSIDLSWINTYYDQDKIKQ